MSVMHAVLSNRQQPEYGVATIPFPIPTEEYDHVLEILTPLGIGDALQRDCQVDEIYGEYPVLRCLEGQSINLDELDFLAKRLDSFSNTEKAQFQGMAEKGRYTDLTDLINLTYSCQQVTVITDFSDLETIGRQHYMNVNGGGARVEELENLDGVETALLLISDNRGTVTPYGVVYDNGMELEQLYDGQTFPAYRHQNCEMEIGIQSASAPDTTTEMAWLYLPAAKGQIEHAMKRIGGSTYHGIHIFPTETALPKPVMEAMDIRCESLEDLNEVCKLTQTMSVEEKTKLGAVVLMAEPEYAYQIKHLAQNLEQFEFIPGAKTPEDYGRYMIQRSGRFEFDDNLDAYYDYARYAEDRMRHESGQFNELGYISYHGTMSLEELMMEDPAEQHQKEQGFQMGGMAL